MAFQTPYFTPSLPFTGHIYGGLRDGMMVLISGSVQRSCKRFQIDFQCGSAPSPRPDIAFHFNARFDDGCVVGNSFERGTWQHEQRKNEMPFRKGHPFEIRFLVNNSSFKVAVDGRHFFEFLHRIPLSRVEAISVSGSIEVSSINFQGPPTNPGFPPTPAFPSAPSFPSVPGFPSAPSFPSTPGFPSSPGFPSAFPQGGTFPPGSGFPSNIYSVPYRGQIYGGLSPSRSVIISGTVLPNATRFHINLKAGNTTALHINPRFDENVIVRNSKINESWGTEDRHLPRGMPLSRGQPFTMWILCEARGFKVAVNGQHLFDYSYRIPNLQQINQLEVEGDVTLTSIS